MQPPFAGSNQSGTFQNLLDGAELASESIDSGAAKFKLDSLIKATNGY